MNRLTGANSSYNPIYNNFNKPNSHNDNETESLISNQAVASTLPCPLSFDRTKEINKNILYLAQILMNPNIKDIDRDFVYSQLFYGTGNPAIEAKCNYIAKKAIETNRGVSVLTTGLSQYPEITRQIKQSLITYHQNRMSRSFTSIQNISSRSSFLNQGVSSRPNTSLEAIAKPCLARQNIRTTSATNNTETNPSIEILINTIMYNQHFLRETKLDDRIAELFNDLTPEEIELFIFVINCVNSEHISHIYENRIVLATELIRNNFMVAIIDTLSNYIGRNDIVEKIRSMVEGHVMANKKYLRYKPKDISNNGYFFQTNFLEICHNNLTENNITLVVDRMRLRPRIELNPSTKLTTGNLRKYIADVVDIIFNQRRVADFINVLKELSMLEIYGKLHSFALLNENEQNLLFKHFVFNTTDRKDINA